MSRPGRPRHPDILTPREWDVVRLVRAGLSNREIGSELKISTDGVKYHVREILGKLELENRHDLARWRPEERRPWPLAVLAPLRLPERAAPVVAGLLGAAVLAALGVLVWALLAMGGGDSSGGLTAETFPERVREALSPAGMVYHVVDVRTGQPNGADETWTPVEAWIDFDASAAREVLRADDPAVNDVERIAVSDATYSNVSIPPRRRSSVCDGVTPYIALPIGLVARCEQPLEIGEFVPAGEPELDRSAQFDGAPSVAYRVEGQAGGGDDDAHSTPSVWTLHVDPETLLPIAFVWEVETLEGGEAFVDMLDSELVPRSSLPADFFDPSSIGYVAPTATPAPDAATD